MYAHQLAERWALQVQFQALALAEGTAVRREVQQFLRGNLQDGLMDRLDVVAGRVWWGCFKPSHPLYAMVTFLHLVVPSDQGRRARGGAMDR